MKYHTKHNLKLLGAILAISAFFFFSFTSTSEAGLRIINVTTNLEQATFIINGSESHSGSGTSWSVAGVPGGTYVIVFGDVKGYITPPSETKALPVPNGGITFNGIYVYEYESEYGGSVNVAIGDVDGDGINDIISDEYGVKVTAVDADGDGYTSDVDCDDTNSAIYPGATEVCNGVDDNCDTIVDGGADADGDGIGSVCDNCPNDYNPYQAESDGSVPGMRGYWKFEEGQGLVAYDTVMVNDGTIYNSTWGTGQVGGALWFKGAQNSDVTIVDDSGNMIIPGKNMSIEVWVYGEDSIEHWAPQWATIGIKSSYGCEKWVNISGVWTCTDVDGDGIAWHWYDDGYGLFYQPVVGGDGHIAFFINHYNDNKAYSSAFTKGEWHHVVGTYDGNYIRIYVDGVEGTSYPYSEDIVDALYPKWYLISGT